MTRRGWILVQFLQTTVNGRCDNLVVLLQKHKVPITLDSYVGELDPLKVGEAHLLKVLEEAVVVGYVRAGVACNQYVRHFTDLGELVDRASLENAGALGQVVWSNFGGRNGRTVRHWGIELQRCVCETTGPSSSATDSIDSVVSD